MLVKGRFLEGVGQLLSYPLPHDWGMKNEKVKKVSNHSELKNLTSEQVAMVMEWMEAMTLKVVVQKIAKPAPEGFGIRTSDSALSRLARRVQREELLKFRSEDAKDAME